MREVFFDEEISDALRAHLPDKQVLLSVLMRAKDQLQNHLKHYKNRRDPEDERLFDYSLYVFDGESWHTLRFSVDDCTSPDHLFVLAVSHQKGKIRL